MVERTHYAQLVVGEPRILGGRKRCEAAPTCSESPANPVLRAGSNLLLKDKMELCPDRTHVIIYHSLHSSRCLRWSCILGERGDEIWAGLQNATAWTSRAQSDHEVLGHLVDNGCFSSYSSCPGDNHCFCSGLVTCLASWLWSRSLSAPSSRPVMSASSARCPAHPPQLSTSARSSCPDSSLCST